MPHEHKTPADLIGLALLLSAVGTVARAVRYAREHGAEQPFDRARFLICTASASLVSVLTGWTLDALGTDRELILAAAGAAGYIGGPLLDLAYDETLAAAKTLLETLRKQIGEKNGKI